MRPISSLGYGVSAVFLLSASVMAQVQPLPIVGGDVLPQAPQPLIKQFFPGPGSGFDGADADPQGITNFNGLVAMGYTTGTATDNSGNLYNIVTDVRVYQGDFVGAVAAFGGGGTQSANGHGTFCEI